MVLCTESIFSKICQSLKIPNPKDVLKKSKIPVFPVKTSDGSIPGFGTLLISSLKDMKNQQLLGSNPEEEALVRQWMEYAVCSVNYADSPSISVQVLKDLNSALAGRTYFAGNSSSLADVALYHLLYRIMSNLTFQEKEQFMNLSRWFGNLQRDKDLRGPNSLLTFSRTPLYC